MRLRWLNITNSIEKCCKMVYNYVNDINAFVNCYQVCWEGLRVYGKSKCLY